jgi:hypothetical protein
MNACMSSMSKRETQELSSKHIYSFTIQDINGNSIEGVKVSYQLKNKEEIVKDTSIITSKTGIVSDFVYATASGSFYRYKSELIYEIKKSGYFTQRGSFNSDNFPNTAETKEQKNGLIILIKPVDYIKDSFILSSKGEELKIKILGFIDVLLLRSLLSDSYLETQSINLIDFKENKYLTFKFVNTNSYNSLRQNKYDIGKTLFDEVIRKILNPLNENLGKSKEFYGYDLTVVGHTKSFADKYAIDQKVLYRYMIPREIVEQYKNKDISGQQVIDASIILMDDERIDLKLQ